MSPIALRQRQLSARAIC